MKAPSLQPINSISSMNSTKPKTKALFITQIRNEERLNII